MLVLCTRCKLGEEGFLTCYQSTCGIGRVEGWDLGGHFCEGLPEQRGCQSCFLGFLRLLSLGSQWRHSMSQEPNATHPALHAVVDCQVLQVRQVGCGICRKQPGRSCEVRFSCAWLKKKAN